MDKNFGKHNNKMYSFYFLRLMVCTTEVAVEFFLNPRHTRREKLWLDMVTATVNWFLQTPNYCCNQTIVSLNIVLVLAKAF